MPSGEPPSLPYHWLEVGNMLLDAASDDLVEPDQLRRLLKDLREVRMAKMRKGVDVLDAAATGGGGVALTGVGAMEIGEGRGFVAGVVEGLRYASDLTETIICAIVSLLIFMPSIRKIGASKELARREQLAEERENTYDGTQNEDEMEF